jgi:hypothetical protein
MALTAPVPAVILGVRTVDVIDTTSSPAALARRAAESMAAKAPPRATYRVQLNHIFTFDDAAAIVPWLARLGVSHLYCSPVFKAAPGSMHGYDVVDFGEVNPELGGREAFDRLVETVHRHDMKIMVDFVPNHMGIEDGANAWWQDVLEHGPSSPYESYFDIDWTPLTDELRDKVLLPVLGDQYGVVLERGELRLRFDRGAFTVWYWETPLPIAPVTYPLLLRPVLERLSTELDPSDVDLLELESVITALERLPELAESTDPGALDARYREQLVARRRLDELVERSAPIRNALDAELSAVNGEVGEPRSFDRLDGLLALQPCRLLEGGRRGDQLPALLRDQHPRRDPAGGAARLSRHPPVADRADRLRCDRRRPHRPPGRPLGPARLLLRSPGRGDYCLRPDRAGRRAGRHLRRGAPGRGGEDSRRVEGDDGRGRRRARELAALRAR